MRKFIIYVLMSFALMGGISYADALIITNKSVSDPNITKDDIKKIFLGKKIKWKDKTKVHFVLSKDKDLHEAFLKTYIKRNPKQFKAYWKNMVFTGKGKTPKSFDTTEELIEYVANTEGAIGYIDSGTTAVNVNTVPVE